MVGWDWRHLSWIFQKYWNNMLLYSSYNEPVFWRGICFQMSSNLSTWTSLSWPVAKLPPSVVQSHRLGTSPYILEYGFLNDFLAGPLYEIQDGCISYIEKPSLKVRNVKHLEHRKCKTIHKWTVRWDDRSCEDEIKNSKINRTTILVRNCKKGWACCWLPIL
jgi:hypothetical protein